MMLTDVQSTPEEPKKKEGGLRSTRPAKPLWEQNRFL
jgi:hypothetical protein